MLKKMHYANVVLKSMIKIISEKHEKKYLYSVFLSEVARTLPHAVLTLILFDKGVRVEQIALVQIFYMLAMVAFEFPSGLMSDILDRKLVYLLSIVFSMIAYVLIFFSNALPMLYLSWFIYGTASAFNNGTLDVSFTKLFQTNTEKLKQFLSRQKMVLSVSAVLGGYLGSILFNNIGTYLFFVSVAIYVVSATVVIIFIPSDRNNERLGKPFREYLANFMLNLKNLISSRILIELIILMGAIQFFYQPFYQYWQAMFLENSINPSVFGFIYIIFRLAFALAAWIFRKVKHSNKNSYIILAMISALAVATFLVDFPSFLLVSTPLMLVLVYIYNLNLDCCLREQTDASVLGTVESINSTFTRILSVIVLGISSVSVTLFSVTTMFVILVVGFTSISIFILYIRGRKK